MGHIIPKLNLNRNPELVDNYGLVCAKNIRLLDDGTIGPDTAEVSIQIQEKLNTLLNEGGTSKEYKIVGVIPYNTCFYLFVIYQHTKDNVLQTQSYIVKYDEKTNAVEKCNCNWNSNYTDDNPTKINGVVLKNLRNDVTLTFGEYYEDNVNIENFIPLKSINLDKSDINDDESQYTQSPNVPLCYLTLNNYYTASVLPGVYQFYIRFKKYDDSYTAWQLVSAPFYTAYKETKLTHQGYLNYANINKQSSDGFVLELSYVSRNDKFKDFQLGFIQSTPENGIVARGWKTFNLDTKIIYFDRDEEYIEELDILDMTTSFYNLYNVKNTTFFKNKVYISNYIEPEINKNLDVENFVTIDVVNNFISTIVTYNNVDYSVFIKDRFVTFIGNKSVDEIFIELINGACRTSIDRYVHDLPPYKVIDTELGNFDLKEHYNDNERLSESSEYTCYTTITVYFEDYTIWQKGIGLTQKDIQDVYNFDFFGDIDLEDDIIGVFVEDWKLYKYSSILGTNNPFKSITIETIYKDRQKDIVKYDFSFIDTTISTSDTLSPATQTLVPFQTYAFYIHFIDNNNITTNGYKIGEVTVIPTYREIAFNYQFFPKFTFNDNLPEGYKACFITIAHIKNKVASIFNIRTANGEIPSTQSNYHHIYGNCIEYDVTAFTNTKNIPIKCILENNQIVDCAGNYMLSSDSSNTTTFGASGKIEFDYYNSDIIGSCGFVVLDWHANEDYLKLSRCTPILTPYKDYIYNEGYSLYLGGYLSYVSKPTYLEYKTYVAGSEVYNKDKDLHLTEKDPIPSLNDLSSIVDRGVFVYSNYDLSYLTLTETLNQHIKKEQIILYNNSLTLDSVYSLDGMWKTDIASKFIPVDFDYETSYDNTIRSSTSIQDEQKIINVQFNTTDYYNVPITKGKIINLKGVGNSILVHTEDSLFTFKGDNTISSNGGEQIQLQESNVFDTGITEIFGSEYGFGGIQKQHHQIVSENGYLFYDSDSNHIYIYQDNQQLNVISKNIKKLLKNVLDVKFASDYYNNRFFIKLIYENTNIILSYDVRSKSFISLHDINFDYAFNSKTLCYLVKNNNIYKKEVVYNSTNVLIQPLYDNVDIFPIYTNSNKTLAKPYVDIICNNDYDNVKVLDYVSWICKKVLNPYREIQTNEFVETDDNSQLIQMNVAEEDEIDYPAQGILIYSNLTAKGTTYFKFNTVAELNAILKENRRLYAEQGLYDATQGQYGSLKPRYMPCFQLGHWNYNGFRNDLDNNDVTGTGYPQTHSDNKSLLYGNYFVVRLIFDVGVNFKLKDLMFAINNSYETRR